MSKPLQLAITPDGPAFHGRVLSYSQEISDTYGTIYYAVMDGLAPPYGPNTTYRFPCPSKDFWEKAIELRMVKITRPIPEGGRIAHYTLAPLGAEPKATAEEELMATLTGKDIAKHVAGAYDLAAKTIKWYNTLHPDFELPPAAVGPLAHTLMISHQRGEMRIPDFVPPKTGE